MQVTIGIWLRRHFHWLKSMNVILITEMPFCHRSIDIILQKTHYYFMDHMIVIELLPMSKDIFTWIQFSFEIEMGSSNFPILIDAGAIFFIEYRELIANRKQMKVHANLPLQRHQINKWNDWRYHSSHTYEYYSIALLPSFLFGILNIYTIFGRCKSSSNESLLFIPSNGSRSKNGKQKKAMSYFSVRSTHRTARIRQCWQRKKRRKIIYTHEMFTLR